MNNLEEEVRRGYTISAEMKKVWKVQMDLLKKLLEVCEKNNLRIWADGGTLLGAVREHGYIPWDDDIDMAMLREDYDKLVEIAPKEFDHPYFFQCAYTEKIYPRGHAQLRMDGTTAILPAPTFIGTHQGIFIDIFPYDAIPDKEEEKIRLIANRNESFTRLQRIVSFNILHPIRSIKLTKYRGHFQSEFQKFENLFRANPIDLCSSVACITFITDFDRFLRDKHWYDETIWVPFEDIQIPIPSGFNQILTKQYGDYMTPKQLGSYHGGFWKLDTEADYSVYLPELKKYYSSLIRKRRLRRIRNILKRPISK